MQKQWNKIFLFNSTQPGGGNKEKKTRKDRTRTHIQAKQKKTMKI